MGSLGRALVEELTPRGASPWGTLAVNLLGSLLLAVLLVRASGHSTRHRQARLLLGTGVMGGFTTFSAFALHVDTLARDSGAVVAVGYLGGGLLSMLLGCAAGVALVRRLARPPAS